MHWQKLEVEKVTYLWIESGNLREMEKIKRKYKTKVMQTKTAV